MGTPDAPVDTEREPSAQDQDFHTSSMWRWRWPASAVVGSMFAILGLLFVAGVLSFRSEDALANARPSDLVTILDSLEAEKDRLEAEEQRLTDELEALREGSSAEALAQAEQRLAALEVLAGTTPVRGPGLRMVLRDPDAVLDAATLLNAVQELRDAGAESIEISERRIVVDTWFADPGEGSDPGIRISGDLRSSPYTILAIGDGPTLATAMQIPGGLADTVRGAGAELELDVREDLRITSTVPVAAPDYAEPVTNP